MLRMHRVSASRWARLAATRLAYATEHPEIDLVELEAAPDQARRLRAEHALIQAYVDALEPQRSAAR